MIIYFIHSIYKYTTIYQRDVFENEFHLQRSKISQKYLLVTYPKETQSIHHSHSLFPTIT